MLRVARAVWGDAAGQIAGLVMALNVPLVTESARVLRLELEIVLCMAFFFIAFVRDVATLAMVAADARPVGDRARCSS